MAEVRDEAFLLRRVAYGDSSCIIHILAGTHGRLSLMARGARRANSPFRASLEPLYRLKLGWRPGRTGMGTLTEVERGSEMVGVARSLEGLQLCAVAAHLFQEGDPQGFAELQRAFGLLAERRPQDGMLAGIWSLLDDHGLLGALDHCWQCGQANEVLGWREAECRCPACGGGQVLSPGLRRAVPAFMRSPRVSLSAADLTMWTRMIQDVLRRHGIRPPHTFQAL
jgi:DNA repair protein RecO (recombination protein O)